MKQFFAAAALAAVAGSALAESHAAMGDAEAGEDTFKKCKACHMVVNTETEEVIYKGGKIGPNLYGVIGREAASVEDYNYGSSLKEAAEKGLVWDEENFLAYVQDPKGFLADYLDDKSARSKMSYKLRKGGEDVLAYLMEVGPEMEEMEATEATMEADQDTEEGTPTK
jgi:cytochrome c